VDGYEEIIAIYYIYRQVIPNIFKPQNCRLLLTNIQPLKTSDTVNVFQLTVFSDQDVS